MFDVSMAFIQMSCIFQQHTPPWLIELYTLWVPLLGAVWLFCCGRLANVGGPVGVTDSQRNRLPGPALSGGFQLLVGRLHHEAASFRTQELVLAYWWVGVGLRFSGCWAQEFLELCRTTQGEHLGQDEPEREGRNVGRHFYCGQGGVSRITIG